jgi:hypothetical protein
MISLLCLLKKNVGEMTPLCMNWSDECEDAEEQFVLVESRKKNKNQRKSPIIVSRPTTRSQKAVNMETDKSAQLPSRDVRERKKNSKFK